MRVLSALFAVLLLCSCNGHTEVRDRTFVSTVAVQQDLDSFFVTVTDEVGEYSGYGNSILSALNSAEENSGKNMFFGHTELLSMNVDNLDTNLIILLKSNYFSPNTLLCTTKSNSNISKETTSKIQTNDNNGYLKAMTISSTLQDLLSKGFSEVPFVSDSDIKMGIIN
ncbi:hypothetical protein FACS1894132_12640 [Clostridia bacterium]|nr:hypothetical protein FACS1894132_12640 [Clostridia bacterium]